MTNEELKDIMNKRFERGMKKRAAQEIEERQREIDMLIGALLMQQLVEEHKRWYEQLIEKAVKFGHAPDMRAG